MRTLGIAFLTMLGLVAAGCGSSEDEVVLSSDAAGEIVINMDEFSFGVDRIDVVAGETVTLIIVNGGDNEHEFMIGRNLVKTEQGYPNGFEHDFFEDFTPIVDPPSAGMDMADMGDMDMGDDAMEDDGMGDMDMGDGGEEPHPGFMVQRRAGEVARLTITIPENAVGMWEIGCFRGRGSHWDAGMRATLNVLEA